MQNRQRYRYEHPVNRLRRRAERAEGAEQMLLSTSLVLGMLVLLMTVILMVVE